MKGDEIIKYMPDSLRRAMAKGEPPWEDAEEIRIRTGKPVFFYIGSREYVLQREGGLLETTGSFGRPYRPTKEEIEEILKNMTGYSMYAYEEERREGYLTLEGGHRVGLAGQTVLEDGKLKTMKDTGFLNIRIAHEKRNCGRKVAGKLIKDGEYVHSLILSPPGCGKTTLLRDLIRLFSDGFYYEEEGKRKYMAGVTVGVVDERSEIGASVCGVPAADLGMRTDLLHGCPKHTGIFLLLRSMAPKVIAVDEIGNEQDFEAVRQAANSGCTILATAHGHSVRELQRKEIFASFLKEGIFSRYVILSGRKGKGTVEGVEAI